jgi:hypothetical protein
MIGGEMGRPVRNSTGPGTPMPMPHSAAGQVARRPQQLVEELLDARQAALGPGRDVGRLVTVPEDPAIEVVTATSMLVAPRSATSRCPASARKPDAARRPAAGARTGLGLHHEAGVHQLGDALAHDPTRQAGPRHELRPRQGTGGANLVQHERQGVVGELDAILGHGPIIRPVPNRAGTFVLDRRKYPWDVQFLRVRPEFRPHALSRHLDGRAR